MTDQDPATPPVYVAPPAPAPVLVPGRRTTLAAAAGVVLIVLGVLGGLVALAALTIGRSVVESIDFSTFPGMQDIQDPASVVGGAIAFGGILLLVFSAFYVIGGVGALRSAGWGRVIGIIVGIIGTLFWLPAITGSNGAGGGSPIVALVFLVAHLYAFIALAFFWRSKPSLA